MKEISFQGHKTVRWGRWPIVVLGTVVNFSAYILIFFNIPFVAPHGDTDEVNLINPPSVAVAIICSLLLGFGDACYNTQMMSLLGGVSSCTLV